MNISRRLGLSLAFALPLVLTQACGDGGENTSDGGSTEDAVGDGDGDAMGDGDASGDGDGDASGDGDGDGDAMGDGDGDGDGDGSDPDDRDGDGIPDLADNCPDDPNPDQNIMACSDVGATCQEAADCENGTCLVNVDEDGNQSSFGYCTIPCQTFADCPDFWSCDTVGDNAGTFCKQDS